MVVVAQLVRAPDCGSGGRRFETDLPPLKGILRSPFFYGPENFLNTNSWIEDGLYSLGKTPKHYTQVINEI